MKKVLLVACLFTGSYGFSQADFRFADSTAQWNYTRQEFFYQGYGGPLAWTFYPQNFIVGDDTVLNSVQYQKIVQDNPPLTYYVRKDSTQKVFIYDTILQSDRMIYDFGLGVGDTLRLGNLTLVVVSVGFVSYGHVRKFMILDPVSNSYPGWFQGGMIVEGIGAIHSHLMNPYLEEFTGIGEFFELNCFRESNFISSCFTSIQKVSVGTITLSPNPATTYLTIQSSENFPANTSFQLFDITGRMVLQKQLNIQTTQIELSGVSKGMYLYNVVSNKERVGAGKVVVE